MKLGVGKHSAAVGDAFVGSGMGFRACPMTPVNKMKQKRRRAARNRIVEGDPCNLKIIQIIYDPKGPSTP